MAASHTFILGATGPHAVRGTPILRHAWVVAAAVSILAASVSLGLTERPLLRPVLAAALMLAIGGSSLLVLRPLVRAGRAGSLSLVPAASLATMGLLLGASVGVVDVVRLGWTLPAAALVVLWTGLLVVVARGLGRLWTSSDRAERRAAIAAGSAILLLAALTAVWPVPLPWLGVALVELGYLFLALRTQLGPATAIKTVAASLAIGIAILLASAVWYAGGLLIRLNLSAEEFWLPVWIALLAAFATPALVAQAHARRATSA